MSVCACLPIGLIELSSLTEDDLARCCRNFGIPPPSGILKKLLELGAFWFRQFMPEGAEGPNEGAFWFRQFMKKKINDQEVMMKD